MTDLEKKWNCFKIDISNKWLTGDQDFWSKISDDAKAFLVNFRSKQNEELANEAWFICGFCEIHAQMLEAWENNKDKEYTKAWCCLERAEIISYQLLRNPITAELITTIETSLDRIRNWQLLYPYGVFASPEFLVKSRECSICSKERSPWHHCGHKKGKVYCGKLCHDIVTKMDILGLAVVTDPVQKYSVLQLDRDDEGEVAYMRRHAAIAYGMTIIPNIFGLVKVIKTRIRWPYDKFPNIGGEDPCPCESGNPFKSCCAGKGGILRPHLDIHVNQLIK